MPAACHSRTDILTVWSPSPRCALSTTNIRRWRKSCALAGDALPWAGSIAPACSTGRRQDVVPTSARAGTRRRKCGPCSTTCRYAISRFAVPCSYRAADAWRVPSSRYCQAVCLAEPYSLQQGRLYRRDRAGSGAQSCILLGGAAALFLFPAAIFLQCGHKELLELINDSNSGAASEPFVYVQIRYATVLAVSCVIRIPSLSRLQPGCAG